MWFVFKWTKENLVQCGKDEKYEGGYRSMRGAGVIVSQNYDL